MKDMKVDFMIVGAMKSGTTTVARMLEQHPDVVLCSVKEPDFFSQAKNWRQELPEYEKLYEQKEGVIYGEASTSYTFYPHRNLEVWKDIHAYNPDCKLIYIVREPLGRTVSQYVHMVERGYFSDSFEQAILRHPEILNYSRYYMQIQPYIETFGREQVLILDFDDLKYTAESLFREVTAFLHLDYQRLPDCTSFQANEHTAGGGRVNHKLDRIVNHPPEFAVNLWRKLPENFRKKLFSTLSGQKRNAVTQKPEPDRKTKRMILNLLESDIMAFEALTGRDYSHWRQVS